MLVFGREKLSHTTVGKMSNSFRFIVARQNHSHMWETYTRHAPISYISPISQDRDHKKGTRQQ